MSSLNRNNNIINTNLSTAHTETQIPAGNGVHSTTLFISTHILQHKKKHKDTKGRRSTFMWQSQLTVFQTLLEFYIMAPDPSWDSETIPTGPPLLAYKSLRLIGDGIFMSFWQSGSQTRLYSWRCSARLCSQVSLQICCSSRSKMTALYEHLSTSTT